MSSKLASQKKIERFIEEASSTINEAYWFIKERLLVRQLMDSSTPIIYIKTEDLQIGAHYVQIDLIVSLRATFLTNNSFEKRFHLKNLLASISEGYKLIMNFGKQRKYSLLMLLKEDVIKLRDGKLLDKFDDITSKLELFGDTEINQNLRNLTLHYDNDMMKVYDATVNLKSEDDCVKKACIFFELIQEIKLFCREVDGNVKDKFGQDKPIPCGSVKLDIMKTHGALKMTINPEGKLKDILNNILPGALNGLDFLAYKNKSMEKIKNFIEENTPLACMIPEIQKIELLDPEFQNIKMLINNEMLLRFMILDFVAIIDAYLYSKSDIESAMNFRRVMVTKTSALIHLYGYEKHEKDQSVWCSIKKMVPTGNQLLKDKMNKIDTLLSSLGNNKEEKNLRAKYVHLFDNKKHCGNLKEVLESVEQLDPTIHLVEVMLMLEIYKRVTSFTQQLLETLAINIHEENVENTKKILDKTDEAIEKLYSSALPDNVRKIFVEIINKIKIMVKMNDT